MCTRKNSKAHLINIEKNIVELIRKKTKQYNQLSSLIKTTELIELIKLRDNSAI